MSTIEVNVLEELLGQVLVKVVKGCRRVGPGGTEEVADGQDYIEFWLEDGRIYEFDHCQSCCENVYIESVVGDLEDLVGSPLLKAEESTGEMDSGTWTFYKFATLKGYVDIRWNGESNGYYSESVDHGFLERSWKSNVIPFTPHSG